MNKKLNLKPVKVGRARVVITSLLTFLMVALMVFTLLLQVRFDIKQFNGLSLHSTSLTSLLVAVFISQWVWMWEWRIPIIC